MFCPYCGTELEVYEIYVDYNDIDNGILRLKKHYWCPDCSRAYTITEKYRIEDKGTLEEVSDNE